MKVSCGSHTGEERMTDRRSDLLIIENGPNYVIGGSTRQTKKNEFRGNQTRVVPSVQLRQFCNTV